MLHYKRINKRERERFWQFRWKKKFFEKQNNTDSWWGNTDNDNSDRSKTQHQHQHQEQQQKQQKR